MSGFPKTDQLCLGGVVSSGKVREDRQHST